VALAALVFAAGWIGMRLSPTPVPWLWPRVAAIAFASGTMIGWTAETVPLESLTVGDWTRSLAFAAVATLSPLVAAAALAAGITVPSFRRILGRAAERPRRPVTLALGVLMIAITLLAVQAALGLVFDPRYRDFPFAPLVGAGVPLLLTMPMPKRLREWGPAAEMAGAATLALAAVYILFNETFANWQALWFCGGLAVLALTLLWVRDEPG
jgi:glucan 1,3-beta-glucosidase